MCKNFLETFQVKDFGNLNSVLGADGRVGICRAVALEWMKHSLASQPQLLLANQATLTRLYQEQREDKGDADAMLKRLFALSLALIPEGSTKITPTFEHIMPHVTDKAKLLCESQQRAVTVDLSISNHPSCPGHAMALRVEKVGNSFEWYFMDPNFGIFKFEDDGVMFDAAYYFQSQVGAFLDCEYKAYRDGGTLDMMQANHAPFNH